MASEAKDGAARSPGLSTDVGDRRAALVLAVSTYTDATLRQLRAPAGDADDFGQVLGSPDMGGFEVTTVLDGRAQEMRLAAQEFLDGCRPGDLALVYLSCHGLVDARRRLYFAATDTLKGRLAATGLEARWLLDQLEECRARRQVVILDCCFSGAFASGSKGDNSVEIGGELLGQGRGRVVLTASRATEYSFEGMPSEESAMPGSVFTAALVKGIRTGAADSDRNGYISIDDAYAYAFDEVRAAGAQQTPQRWLYGAEGNIVLAKNPVATQAGSNSPAPGQLNSSGGSTPREPLDVPGAMPGGDGAAPRPQPRKPLRPSPRTAAAVVVVAAVMTAGLLLWRPWTSVGGRDEPAFSFRAGRYVDASAPWHITTSAGPEAPTRGCTVQVRDRGEPGSIVASTKHPSTQGETILQVAHTGSFSLVYPSGCLVSAEAGRGDATYPVTISAGVGDSLAWNPSGKIMITAEESSAFPCYVNMVNAETGGVEQVTVTRVDDPQTYDPPATSSLYMSLPGSSCIVTARGAPAVS